MITILIQMKRLMLVACCWLLVAGSFAQTISQKLQKAFSAFEKDSQLKNAISSLYVIDANSGLVVFDKNSQIGLAPASTQKIITSVTAFELLGKDYRYKTVLGYDGEIQRESLKGNLILVGSGDPTLGSWRYITTNDTVFINTVISVVDKQGIRNIERNLIIDDSKFSINPVPNGWIWQDIGNYYGAGSWGFNWHENQVDIILASGTRIGDSVRVVRTEPDPLLVGYINELSSAKSGSGDNAYAYISPFSQIGLLQGTIPVNEKRFLISASLPDPLNCFSSLVKKEFSKKRITIGGDLFSNLDYKLDNKAPGYKLKILYTYYSPSLDSIIYWLNKKSINLYAEALLKTFAYKENGFGSTDSGVVIVKNFWKQREIDEDELNIVDGSGLSPLNRVTTHAQVKILQYARYKDWFPYFYTSLPEYNGMNMKSGTINGVKGFCGYHKARNGKEYVFSFLVNNYNGSPSALINKMYKVLDVLK